MNKFNTKAIFLERLDDMVICSWFWMWRTVLQSRVLREIQNSLRGEWNRFNFVRQNRSRGLKSFCFTECVRKVITSFIDFVWMHTVVKHKVIRFVEEYEVRRKKKAGMGSQTNNILVNWCFLTPCPPEKTYFST